MKWIGGVVGTIVIVGLGLWLVTRSPVQMPGELVADQGREHTTADKLKDFKYNSNPPTSGPHVEEWVKPGIYNEPKDKYQLIHSLEHGYIEIHYKCDDCKETLAAFVNKVNLHRMIVVPNPEIENKIVMVAWDRKLILDTWDEKAAEDFARAYHNKGPEQTME